MNRLVNVMLEDAPITPKTACFCPIDQRTFECQWATVEAVARHKAEGRKVEVFYFLAQRWFDRAWDSTKDKSKLAAWWGREDYESFRPLSSFARARRPCADDSAMTWGMRTRCPSQSTKGEGLAGGVLHDPRLGPPLLR